MDFFLWTELSKVRNQLTKKNEPLQPFLFLSFLRFSDARVALDVGSNVGLYSLMATLGDRVNCVYAFEPDESAYPELNKNLRLNGVEKKVKALQVAVSDHESSVCFGSHAPMSGINGVVSTSIHDAALFREHYNVQTVTLDQFGDIRGKVLGIKIDVEGHELQVIEGAIKLLMGSPAFIQIEHFVGSGIDSRLNQLGYFCFFTAGHDHYFTNIRNFQSPLFVKQAVEHAAAWLIETYAGRWPNVSAIKSSLTVTYEISGVEVHAKGVLQDGFFVDPEYAFYLMVDGIKASQQWYQEEPNVIFHIPESAESIEIRCFVREKHLPDKKVMIGEFVKCLPVGFRATSAVGESVGLPSRYSAVASGSSDIQLGYPDIDLSPILQGIADGGTEVVIQLGGDSSALTIASRLRTSSKGFLSVICTPKQALALTHVKSHDLPGGQDVSSWMKVQSVANASEFESTLKSIAQGLDSALCLLLRGQFLADIDISMSALSSLIASLPRGSRLYTEGLANGSYHQQLAELASKHDIEVDWVFPRSTIVPPERLRLTVSD